MSSPRMMGVSCTSMSALVAERAGLITPRGPRSEWPLRVSVPEWVVHVVAASWVVFDSRLTYEAHADMTVWLVRKLRKHAAAIEALAALTQEPRELAAQIKEAALCGWR